MLLTTMRMEYFEAEALTAGKRRILRAGETGGLCRVGFGGPAPPLRFVTAPPAGRVVRQLPSGAAAAPATHKFFVNFPFPPLYPTGILI